MQGNYDRQYFEGFLRKESEASPRNRLRLRELLRSKRGGRLLEIGCGLGGFTRVARQHFNVTCLDVSDYAIKRLRAIPDVNVIQGDIEEIELRPESYDVVVAFNVLEHLMAPAGAIEKIRDALTDGGVLLGSVPNNYGPLGGTVTAISRVVDRTHYSTYPLGRWRRLFGSNYQRVRFFGEIPFGKNASLFVRHKMWAWICLNAVFACEK